MLIIASDSKAAHTCTSLCMLCSEWEDVSLSMKVTRACLTCACFKIALLQVSSLKQD